MEKEKDRSYIKYGLTSFFVISGSIFFYYLIFHASSFFNILQKTIMILMPIIDGMILAYLMNPIMNSLEKQCFIPLLHHIGKSYEGRAKGFVRLISILVTFIVVILGVYAFFAMAIPQIITSIETIFTQFPKYAENLIATIGNVLEKNPEIESYAVSMLNNYSQAIENVFNNTVMPNMNSLIVVLSTGIMGFVKGAWNLIIGFIISVYILAGKEKFAAQFKKVFYSLFPIDSANRIINNIRFTHKTMGGYFIGKILDSIIIGIICLIGTTVFGFPFAVLISVIIGITNVIPFFGPFLGAIPTTLIVLMVDPMKALYFVLFVLVLQQLDGNVIGPKILGDSTGLSSFWVIFAITTFGGLFGVVGMIIGVPVFAVIFATAKSIIESSLNAKNLPVQTEKYLKLLYIDTEKNNEMVEFDDSELNAPAKSTIKIRIKDRFKKK